MPSAEIVSALASFEGRGPGTDAERRAAGWLASELASPGRNIRLEPFWCRPNWALAHLWHVALAVAGSLLALASPQLGVALLAIALISMLADGLRERSLGRRLSPERASQNVVASPASTPAPRAKPTSGPEVRLILTANYDAGRTGIAYRDVVRALTSRLRHATAGAAPGWLGWLTIAIAWLLAVAILRVGGYHSTVLNALQLPPTVALVSAFALLMDVALSNWSPAAGDNASGVAVAIGLMRALDVAPPRHLSVELVLQGAGEGGGIGLRRHLAARRRELRPTNTIVLGFAPCGSGQPRWWASDGRLLALRYSSELRRLCASVAAGEPHLGAGEHRGRGATPALPARQRRLPAITLGCLDRRALVPRSHQPSDTPSNIDPGALDEMLQFALLLIDRIDTFVGSWSASSVDAAPRLREKRRPSLRFSRNPQTGPTLVSRPNLPDRPHATQG